MRFNRPDRSLIVLFKVMAEGWGYVFSPSYRLKKHQEWRKATEGGGAFYGVASRLMAFVFSLLIPILVWLVTQH